MAMSLRYTCDQCGFSLEGWDDGNPYIEFPPGQRHFFYHPGGEAELREIAVQIAGHVPSEAEFQEILREKAGNAPDHICRDCGEISKVDPERNGRICPNCNSARIEDVYGLEGKKCVKCSGRFAKGIMAAIS